MDKHRCHAYSIFCIRRARGCDWFILAPFPPRAVLAPDVLIGRVSDHATLNDKLSHHLHRLVFFSHFSPFTGSQIMLHDLFFRGFSSHVPALSRIIIRYPTLAGRKFSPPLDSDSNIERDLHYRPEWFHVIPHLQSIDTFAIFVFFCLVKSHVFGACSSYLYRLETI